MTTVGSAPPRRERKALSVWIAKSHGRPELSNVWKDGGPAGLEATFCGAKPLFIASHLGTASILTLSCERREISLIQASPILRC